MREQATDITYFEEVKLNDGSSLTITKKQHQSLLNVKERFPNASDPFVLYACDGAIGIWCGDGDYGPMGQGMMIGIEKDGYAHT